MEFDLVPAGEQLGASANRWDTVAVENAVARELLPGLTIRHVSAPAFLTLKWAAHLDRGAKDALASRDLEDFIALLASRPTIAVEIAASSAEVRDYLKVAAGSLLSDPDRDELLNGHLMNVPNRRAVVSAVRQLLELIAA